MSSSNSFRSDLWEIYNIIQGSMIVYPKEMIIAVLRDMFSKDRLYSYSKDQWGFANTVDHTDLPIGSGIYDNLTTRVFIGENYRQDGIYYPAILVKNNSSRYVPVSINRDKGTVQSENIIYEDGYGNQSIISRPKYFITAGFWDGSFSIDIMSRSLRARDDLVELVSMCFTEMYFESLVNVGIIVKPVSIGSPSEMDDRNDKLYRQSITLEVRTQWERAIPVGNLIETILFSIYFGTGQNIAPNITINTEVTLEDILLNI